MPGVAYTWLKMAADINGSSDVQDREGSLEITGFSQGIKVAVGSTRSKLAGRHTCAPMLIEKKYEFVLELFFIIFRHMQIVTKTYIAIITSRPATSENPLINAPLSFLKG